MVKIELTLLDNGLDFIIEGLKPTTRIWGHGKAETIWKYAVLNVFSGIELILKDRLRKEHWSLIFEDISSANEEKLTHGDFVSVNHNSIIKRLDGISNIKLNDTSINNLRKLRNRFEHFEVKVEINECKHAIANAVRELIVFWDKNISHYSNIEQNQKFNWIKSMAFEFGTYAENMLQKHREKIDGIINNSKSVLVQCESCSNQSFMIYKGENKNFECFVCELKISKEDFLKNTRDLEIEQSNEKDSFLKHEEYDKNCPVCKNQTRIRYKPSYFLATDEYQPDYFICINCLHHETQSEINSREFEKELLELEKSHTPEEFLEILKNRIKHLDVEE